MLSAVENIAQRFQLEKQDVFSHVLTLSKNGLVEFYKYGAADDAEVAFIGPTQLEEEIREHPYEVFFGYTDKTQDRITELSSIRMS